MPVWAPPTCPAITEDGLLYGATPFALDRMSSENKTEQWAVILAPEASHIRRAPRHPKHRYPEHGFRPQKALQRTPPVESGQVYGFAVSLRGGNRSHLPGWTPEKVLASAPENSRRFSRSKPQEQTRKAPGLA